MLCSQSALCTDRLAFQHVHWKRRDSISSLFVVEERKQLKVERGKGICRLPTSAYIHVDKYIIGWSCVTRKVKGKGLEVAQ